MPQKFTLNLQPQFASRNATITSKYEEENMSNSVAVNTNEEQFEKKGKMK